ncbi:hypothetical protein JRQ81_018487, partial [Phrynocephalus forsythii]
VAKRNAKEIQENPRPHINSTSVRPYKGLKKLLLWTTFPQILQPSWPLAILNVEFSGDQLLFQ